MKSLALRHVNRAAVQMKYAAAQWEAQGESTVMLLPVKPHSRYIAFQAYSQQGMWLGLIEAKEWLARFAPEVAALAASHYDEQHVLMLFSATPKPFECNLSNLSYTHLQVSNVSNSEDLPEYPLVCVNTKHGTVWLQTLPADLQWHNAPGARVVSALPVYLSFELGHSTISFALLTQLDIGDVVLINKENFLITTCGKVVGHYQLTEGEIKVENFDPDISDSNGYDAHEDLPPMEETHHQSTAQTSFGHLPVKLEFILEERPFTVADLSQLSPGTLLELQPDVEQKITIRANGVVLAKGELIQLDGRLGVEITTLYGKSLHK